MRQVVRDVLQSWNEIYFLLNKILRFAWSENISLLHETEGNYELDLSPCKNLFSVTLSFRHQLVFVSGNQ